MLIRCREEMLRSGGYTSWNPGERPILGAVRLEVVFKVTRLEEVTKCV